MKRIEKNLNQILSTKYKKWLEALRTKGEVREGTYTYYYDDIVMALYKCQLGVCAYTEMYICIHELFEDKNWIKGRFKIPDEETYRRVDHIGELDHYDPENKKIEYWNWQNLFMIHAKVNSIKTSSKTLPYLKPDLPDYAPEKYFDYDFETNFFIPNTEIVNEDEVTEIKHMIDNVLCLNHGVVLNERRDYINLIKSKKARGEDYLIDRFHTAVDWALSEE